MPEQVSLLQENIFQLIESLDSEMDRFWMRFNIFSAVQVTMLFAFFANARFFVANK